MHPFDFHKDYILENERAKLSPLSEAHFSALFSVANHPDIWVYFLEKGLGEVAFQRYIQHALQERESRLAYPFVVYDKLKSQFAGMTKLYEVNEQLSHVKLGHSWYGKAFQGTRLNKNCKYLLFSFVFEQLKAERIGFGLDEQNIISKYALKSVGCKEEGRLRSFLIHPNGKDRSDLILMSILRAEWLNTSKQQLLQKL